MNLLQQVNLKPFNTFGIAQVAAYFSVFKDIVELIDLVKCDIAQTNGIKILGGGSNILLSKDLSALLLKNEIKGIVTLEDTENTIEVSVGAGELWHDFVLWCVAHNYQGVENLSLIPGTVGAAPMQNIGAYGAEVKDTITSVTTLNLATLEIVTFLNKDCNFGYRTSIFKTTHKEQCVILQVNFLLQKTPKFNVSYGAIKDVLHERGITTLTCKSISDAVIHIRESKLPNPSEIGNAGSFFKNPEIDTIKYELLKAKHPDMPGYTITEDITKVPAGWLIEQAGWKGYRSGDIGVHAKQALVLVNFGEASGIEVFNLSTQIIESVKNKYDIVLEREVNIW
jgi:UDP-N-acetylmuramate dehydrogenase